jgi:serine/threonine-protein phosphatase 4 catalytic subunit
MWSDPDASASGFIASTRGAGYTFGGDVVHAFLRENGLQHILRAHQLCMEGFQVLYDGAVCTVWSAPNYCYRCGNVAAVLEFDEHLNRCCGCRNPSRNLCLLIPTTPPFFRNFKIFEAAPQNERGAPAKKPPPDYFL